MSTEPFIGEVKIFGFNFAPKMYAQCNGQILSIASNTALFSLLGTTYGGNGQTTFALPNMQGRFPIGQGNGSGLPSHTIGEISGNTYVTLLSSNLPAHIHTLSGLRVKVAVNGSNGGENAPDSSFPGNNTSQAAYASSNSGGTTLAANAINVGGTTDISGNNMPIAVQNPYLVMNYCIAQYGIFPSRN
ncbi:MAG: tail fiber protein [Bacteroidia bacterium]|nr:tail fiber protein [Bacteroidia bacterium]